MIRWVLAGFALELDWLFACESWRERAPIMLAVLVLVGGTLAGAAWHAVVRPKRVVAGALALAGAMFAFDQLLDLASPYPRRFGIVGWEVLRAAAVVGGFAIAARFAPQHRWWQIASRTTCALSLAIALLVPVAMTYLAIDGSRDDSEPADAALVLGFALADDGTPRPQLVGRIDHAVDLVKRGVVTRLVLSGGVIKHGHTEAGVMRDRALAAGLPADALVLDEDARSTIENFACARPLLDKLGARRVLLVTEPWHMTRSMLLAERHGLAPLASPATSAIWESPRHAAYWLFRDAIAYVRERIRDPFAEPGVCRARECEGCRTF